MLGFILTCKEVSWTWWPFFHIDSTQESAETREHAAISWWLGTINETEEYEFSWCDFILDNVSGTKWPIWLPAVILTWDKVSAEDSRADSQKGLGL
jgi:hypothetical protein